MHLYFAVELLFSGVARVLLGITWLVKIHGRKAPAKQDIENGYNALEGTQTSIIHSVYRPCADLLLRPELKSN